MNLYADLVGLYWLNGKTIGEIARHYRISNAEAEILFDKMNVVLRDGRKSKNNKMRLEWMLLPSPEEYKRGLLK